MKEWTKLMDIEKYPDAYEISEEELRRARLKIIVAMIRADPRLYDMLEVYF